MNLSLTVSITEARQLPIFKADSLARLFSGNQRLLSSNIDSSTNLNRDIRRAERGTPVEAYRGARLPSPWGKLESPKPGYYELVDHSDISNPASLPQHPHRSAP